MAEILNFLKKFLEFPIDPDIMSSPIINNDRRLK